MMSQLTTAREKNKNCLNLFTLAFMMAFALVCFPMIKIVYLIFLTLAIALACFAIHAGNKLYKRQQLGLTYKNIKKYH